MPLTPQDFVSKWKRGTTREKQTYQEHFLDLCPWWEVSREAERRGSKRTLTNLYNARPTWLDLAHKRLDEAVFAAYGWKSDLSDEEILEKLLALNLERAKQV